jgi:hypothetical protein
MYITYSPYRCNKGYPLHLSSTPTVFGTYAVGFDNIRHVTPAVEACIRTGEALINHLTKH